MRIVEAGLPPIAKSMLQEKGFRITTCVSTNDVEMLIYLATDKHCDAIVYDLERTHFAGFPQELPRGTLRMPLIGIASMSTSAQWSEARAAFLEKGGTDLIASPVNVRELIATMRRSIQNPWNFGLILRARRDDIIIELDMHARIVKVNEVLIRLTRREFNIMALLMRFPGKCLSREEKMSGVDSNADDTRVVDSQIKRIRAQFDAVHEKARKLIVAEYGNGYRLDVEPI
jgi:DNA-binding response OmpR family regulator